MRWQIGITKLEDTVTYITKYIFAIYPNNQSSLRKSIPIGCSRVSSKNIHTRRNLYWHLYLHTHIHIGSIHIQKLFSTVFFTIVIVIFSGFKISEISVTFICNLLLSNIFSKSCYKIIRHFQS